MCICGYFFYENQKIVEKGSKSVHQKILFASDDVIPGKHSSAIVVNMLNVSNLGFLLMKNSK